MSDLISRSMVGTMTYLVPNDSLVATQSCNQLELTLSECISTGQFQLVLDLEQVAQIGGRAMEVMLDASSRLSLIGGSLKFVSPTELVRDILIANGLADPVSFIGGEFGRLHDIGSHAIEPSSLKFGDILLGMGLISQAQLDEASALQAKNNKRLGTLLVEMGMLTSSNRLVALSRQLGVPYIPMRIGMFEKSATDLLSREMALRFEVLPLFRIHNQLTLATNDPQAIPQLDQIQDVTGCKLHLVLTDLQDILKFQLDAYSGAEFTTGMVENMATDIELVTQEQADFNKIDEMAGGSPVINFVNGLIQRAVRDGASDIHIEVGRTRSLVRFRIDGLLYEVMSSRNDLHPAIVSRLKVMANLDIAERRLPQDGRIQVVTQGRTVDLRLSSLPGIYGEKIVLRVLDKNQSILDVEKLGLSSVNLTMLKKLLGRSNGLLLVTGPTGSGKTTTLYAAINYLRTIEKNIVTIEDPVEYQIDLINQNQVNNAVGLSFSRMLRHVLRQDPDIIMVGEIRDRDTAEIAVQAALTGHLVLSTLHTNSAVGAISRMIDMGVEPYMLSSALAGVVAQRLVRGICPHCKTSYLPQPEVVARYKWPENVRLSRGRGCSNCYDSGYRGRMGIHEVIETSDALQRLMAGSPSKDALLEFTRRSGYSTMFDDGLMRVLKGSTTIEEISRVTQED
ncbi:MAG: Flp pilus assembly complex ATPase component TadA [Betaproteobacteria bacterium]|jgi:type IV pilus assembly protein PilB|nr:Flp pilus assembly complex ATPase component TadA [Betaproteobacteria bacterium]MBK7654101.1 Flp pilus assembly complex ATPase component TadA [Betaproteobacteria bacterium]MBP7780130.1 Flp pilus assembly complex ATPase component TadA [Burkholderiaceae bacterium]